MIIQHQKFQEIVNGIIAECHNDQEGLWTIIHDLKQSGISFTSSELREAVFTIIRTLLNEKNIVAMNYQNDRYHIWNLSTDEAISRIDREWKSLGKEPNVGDIVWFTSKERAKKLA